MDNEHLEEKRSFSYQEIKTMCLLCSGFSMIIAIEASQGKHADSTIATKQLENHVDEIITSLWNRNSDD